MSDGLEGQVAGQTTAILLMAYGGPSSLDEVAPYLLDVRGGRPFPPRVLEEVKERYRLIGGRSPLLDITRKQAIALEEVLLRKGMNVRVFVGMRHWYPYIRDAVQAISEAGISRVVALCMAPHFSSVSVGAYFKQYDAAVDQLGARVCTRYVRHWHNRRDLLKAYAAKTSEALGLFPEKRRQDVQTLFTAHSLPISRLTPDDPYDRQQLETAAGVARILNLHRWAFAYQSQGYSSEPWLGPTVEDKLREFAGSGVRDVLIVPTGFVCDHVEILYDVDIAFRGLAESLGLRLERSASLNDDPRLIRALAGVVAEALNSCKGMPGADNKTR